MPVTPLDERPTVSTPHKARADDPRADHRLVAFVPGLGLNADEWHVVRDELAGSSVVMLLPSLGQPAPRPADLSAEAQATRLLELLPQGAPTILVGHSASCPVVVRAASRSADVVGLVLVGPVTDPAAQSWPRCVGGLLCRLSARARFSPRPQDAHWEWVAGRIQLAVATPFDRGGVAWVFERVSGRFSFIGVRCHRRVVRRWRGGRTGSVFGRPSLGARRPRVRASKRACPARLGSAGSVTLAA